MKVIIDTQNREPFSRHSLAARVTAQAGDEGVRSGAKIKKRGAGALHVTQSSGQGSQNDSAHSPLFLVSRSALSGSPSACLTSPSACNRLKICFRHSNRCTCRPQALVFVNECI